MELYFSILFRKNFFGVGDGQRKNQRAISLLNKLGLEDRIAGESEKILEEMDYEQVLLILKREIAVLNNG